MMLAINKREAQSKHTSSAGDALQAKRRRLLRATGGRMEICVMTMAAMLNQ